jgi:hypothetical protein
MRPGVWAVARLEQVRRMRDDRLERGPTHRLNVLGSRSRRPESYDPPQGWLFRVVASARAEMAWLLREVALQRVGLGPLDARQELPQPSRHPHFALPL